MKSDFLASMLYSKCFKNNLHNLMWEEGPTVWFFPNADKIMITGGYNGSNETFELIQIFDIDNGKIAITMESPMG